MRDNGLARPLAIAFKGSAATDVEAKRPWCGMKLNWSWGLYLWSCGLEFRGRGRAAWRSGVVGERGIKSEAGPLFGVEVPVTLGERGVEMSVAGGGGALNVLCVENIPGGYGDRRVLDKRLAMANDWSNRDRLVSGCDRANIFIRADVQWTNLQGSALGRAGSSSRAIVREDAAGIPNCVKVRCRKPFDDALGDYA